MGNGTEAIIIAHTSRLVPPWKGKRLMIFLVQAIKKLFVTCQAAYDVKGLGRGPQSNSIYTHNTVYTHQESCTIASHGSVAEMVHEKQMKLEGDRKKKGSRAKMR